MPFLDKLFMPVVVSGADGQTALNIRGDSTGLGQVVHARCCVWCRCPDSATNACGGGIGSGLWASASGTFVRSTTERSKLSFSVWAVCKSGRPLCSRVTQSCACTLCLSRAHRGDVRQLRRNLASRPPRSPT